jgi:hypothetical protein
MTFAPGGNSKQMAKGIQRHITHRDGVLASKGSSKNARDEIKSERCSAAPLIGGY